MEPCTSRSRVDHFFASKKRKNTSPGVKSGKKCVKDVGIEGEGSPCAKGNLVKYLETSPEKSNAVKQKLVYENHNENCGKNEDDREACQHPRLVRKETSQGSSETVRNGDTVPELSGNRSVLKNFANDFLSLYCSELRSTATSPSSREKHDYKRQGSPDHVREVPEKRLPTNSRIKCDLNSAYDGEKTVKDMQSVVAVKTGKFFGNPSMEVPCRMPPMSDVIDVQGTLRKCNKLRKSCATAGECATPGSIQVVSGCRKTPTSGCGSSGSPGEAFWSEAIQVVDGLLDKDHVAISALKNRNGNCYPLENEGHIASKMLCPVDSHCSTKEVSPLPVKHLNFLLEGGDASAFTTSGNDGSDFINLDAQVINKHVTAIPPNAPVTAIQDFISFKSPDSVSPSNSTVLEDQLQLSYWIPPEVCFIYENKGIHKLYPWQVECLRIDGVLDQRNLVYCASTSAGKSLVAEILMLRRVLSTAKIALFVLPYVSICTEKAEHLERLLEPLGKHVRSYFGNQGGATLPKDTSVAVCTIEKANSIINKLLEESRLSEIGIIAIDELHMVGDQHRGYLLELMLTKLRYASGEGTAESSSGESSGSISKNDPSRGLQIVGMSATMPNVATVANWLHAAFYQTDFRPVPLEEFVKVGNTIYDRNMNVVRTLPKSADFNGKDPDHIVELCNEIVQEGHSVLIFCSSRKGCESTAKHVSRFLKKFPIEGSNDCDFSIASAIDALQKSPAGLDPNLEETLPCGVAYHHAGLTVEEREIVETCYRRGLIRVLTATSTLAAGVNLPARRVIFRHPRVGLEFIDGTRYKQMAGRAGRTGIDTKGESVLVCKPEELKRVMGILNECCPSLQSCLSEDKNGMTHAILEVVAGSMVQTADDVYRYVRCTLLNFTNPYSDVEKSARDSLRLLCRDKFLHWDDHMKIYSITPLGRASFGSSLCPDEALIVLEDLSRAREAFVLASDLHMVYLVTPINVDVEPDWELYYQRFMELSKIDQSVGNRVGVSERFLMGMAHGAPKSLKRNMANKKGMREKLDSISDNFKNRKAELDEVTLRVCRRFYVALILARLVQEVPVAEVCEVFKVARGMVQGLQENAGRFASMVSVFCERLGWHDFEGLVSKFQNRVSFGVRAEIVELTTIPYVKGSRARSLYKSGLRTPLAVAEASVSEIAKAIFESSNWDLQERSNQRRMYLGVAKKIKIGAQKIVLDKAEEARIAAFSAFQSLGLKVPHFSLPSLPSVIEADSVEKNRTSTSEGEHMRSTASYDLNMSINCANVHEVDNMLNCRGGEIQKSLQNENLMLKHTDVDSVCDIELNKLGNTDGPAVGTHVRATIPHHGSCHGFGNNPSPLLNSGSSGERNQVQGRVKDMLNNESNRMSSKKSPSNASSCFGGFDSFLNAWENAKEFFFDIHFAKRTNVDSGFLFDIRGLAISWDGHRVYYVSLPKDLVKKGNVPVIELNDKSGTEFSEYWVETVKSRWNRILEIMGKNDVRKFTWNLKVQIQVLMNASVPVRRFGHVSHLVDKLCRDLVDGYLHLPPIQIVSGFDMAIVSWILSPDDEKKPKLDKVAKKKLSPEVMAHVESIGRWKNQMRTAAHNGCCLRVAQIQALHSVLWKIIISENLLHLVENVEMPLVNVIADMELRGIGVNIDACLAARKLLGQKIKQLEGEAHALTGLKFSLYTTADIANVLYSHLKLPIPEARNEWKNHPSTDKHSLEVLRNEHPVINVIKEHRTLAKLLNCTLGSICSLAKLSTKNQKYSLHGSWLQTSTATGRLSMEDPNLQCVEHMVEFKLPIDGDIVSEASCHHKVNARDFFIPTQDDWVIVTADYSQIELRLMAHFSRDASLIELLSNSTWDAFTLLAARWTKKPEDVITAAERTLTKRVIYGILYGIGANTLAEQLDCCAEEAAERIKNFKSEFPDVASWLRETVTSCSRNGYVETLMGRKRFLSKLADGNKKEKSKAQRQAINSICQGSSADLIKIAMVNLHSVIECKATPEPLSMVASKFTMLKDRCHILLQVHDELVLEADCCVVKEAASLLKYCMESAAPLLVPLKVKVYVGQTWGSLEPYNVDQ